MCGSNIEKAIRKNGWWMLPFTYVAAIFTWWFNPSGGE